jgi:Phage gp6-like head-tail connector protein
VPSNPRYQISRVITPATSRALVSLDQAKAALGIDPADTSQDAAIQQQIDQVSAAIDNYCGRTFVRQTYRDQNRYVFNWLNPGDPLMTRQWPIPLDDTGAPILTITEAGAVVDPALWDIDPEAGSLYRLDSSAEMISWTANLIVIDYDAGYDVVPPDVQGAALGWLTGRWMALGRDPTLRSETIPDVITQTYRGDDPSVSQGAMPSAVRDSLSAYRRWFV